MNLTKKLLLFCSCAFVLFPVYAPAALQNTKIATSTLLVTKYGALERKLQDAMLQGDTNTINKILNQNFEERRGDNPNTPIPRTDWIASNINKSANRVMRQMAARDMVNSIIVSYLSLNQDNNKLNMFVVDVWANNGEDSQLIARYSSADNCKTT